MVPYNANFNQRGVFVVEKLIKPTPSIKGIHVIVFILTLEQIIVFHKYSTYNKPISEEKKITN